MYDCAFCGEKVSVEGEDTLEECEECEELVHVSCMHAHLYECTGAETSLYEDND